MIRYDEKRKTYFVQIDTKDTVTQKRKQITKRGFQYKREAKEWEAEFLKSKKTSTHLSFKEMVNLWENSNDSSKQVKIKHKEHFSKRFKELFEYPIDKITKIDLMNWRNNLSKMKFSTNTKNTTISYVKSVFRFANQIYNIADPSIILKPFKKTNEEIMKEVQVWTVEEFNQFVKKIPEGYFKIYFKLLFWTGMRRGEAIALQKSDFEDGWINIRFSQISAT